MAVAEQLGTSQRRVSNIETGRFVPRAEEVQQLARLYRAPAPLRRQLLQAVNDLRQEPAKARVVMSRGAAQMQQRIARVEQGSARVRAFHCSLVLGLLQTEGYARAVFSDGGDITAEELERCVAERMQRQSILGSGRELSLVMSEGALQWQAGSAAVMVEQLDRIEQEIGRPQLRIGIVPWSRAMTVFPLHGFTIYDSRAVQIGTRVATAFLTDAGDVAEHEKLFGELEAAAEWDAAAAPHLRRIAAQYRSLL